MLTRRDGSVRRSVADANVTARPATTAFGRVASVSPAIRGLSGQTNRNRQFAYRRLNLGLINDFDHASYSSTALDTQPLGVPRREFPTHGDDASTGDEPYSVSPRHTPLMQEIKQPMFQLTIHVCRVEHRVRGARSSSHHGDLLPRATALGNLMRNAEVRP
jgi:hypothetical protein